MKAWIVLLVAAGCSSSATSTNPTPSTIENGLATNGIWENGIWENGIWENGIWENGIWENGIWENGIWENGIWENGIWENGIWENGWRADQLRDNPYAAQLLQYIYSCAMPASDGAGGYLSTTIGPSDAQVTLTGAIGVGVNANNTTWWETGTCDESCQRWVSACVLARTNAYGVNVQISMRAPDNAPQKVKDALALGVGEVAEYPLSEGAFFGNIFQTTPLDPAPVSGEGPATGVITATPVFHACAGPGSNIPDLTKRFCSSQGDDQVIDVVGICQPNVALERLGACTGLTAQGAHQECYTDTNHNAGTKFDEVITVFLKIPIATCGNAVCEAGEHVSEASECLSDCPTTTWSRKFDHALDGTFGKGGGRFAITPDNGIIVVANGGPQDLGGGPIPEPNPSGPLEIAMAKYSSNGAHVWSKRIALDGESKAFPAAVTVLADGKIVVLGTLVEAFSWKLWVAKFDADGNMLGGYPTQEGGTANLALFGVSGEQMIAGLVHDAAGNVYGYGVYQSGPAVLDCCVVLDQGTGRNALLFKLNASGHSVWAKGYALPGSGSRAPGQLAVDDNGDLFFKPHSLGTELLKISPVDGSTIWSRTVPNLETGFAIDPATNDLFIAGQYAGAFDFGDGPLPDNQPNAPDYFVARLDNATGDRMWTRFATYSTFQPDTSAFVDARGTRVGFDSVGNVVVAGTFQQQNGALINFGSGSFFSYQSFDQFLTSYTPGGTFRWAKHVPLVLDGFLTAMKINSNDRVVMSGSFSGSMTIDGQFLPNTIPELEGHEETYIASFAIPSPGDVTAPVFDDVPQTLSVQATSAQGAAVWYMPPTATDATGASVFCVPKASSQFPLGSTTVNCTAHDPVGNAAPTSFVVDVVDTRGPAILNIPQDISVVATGNTTPVSYTPPTATDQVSGATSVTCTPPPNSGFVPGTTEVGCTASDWLGNLTRDTFNVRTQAQWGGVLQPINADGSSIFKLGSTIPVKFELTGPSSGITNLVATLSLAKISNGVAGTVVEGVSTGNADEGNQFRYSGGQYIFNLSTRGLTAGTYLLQIDFNDGVTRTVEISLKK